MRLQPSNPYAPYARMGNGRKGKELPRIKGKAPAYLQERGKTMNRESGGGASIVFGCYWRGACMGTGLTSPLLSEMGSRSSSSSSVQRPFLWMLRMTWRGE